jgi:hypothetical protein
MNTKKFIRISITIIYDHLVFLIAVLNFHLFPCVLLKRSTIDAGIVIDHQAVQAWANSLSTDDRLPYAALMELICLVSEFFARKLKRPTFAPGQEGNFKSATASRSKAATG